MSKDSIGLGGLVVGGLVVGGLAYLLTRKESPPLEQKQKALDATVARDAALRNLKQAVKAQSDAQDAASAQAAAMRAKQALLEAKNKELLLRQAMLARAQEVDAQRQKIRVLEEKMKTLLLIEQSALDKLNANPNPENVNIYVKILERRMLLFGSIESEKAKLKEML